MRKCCHTDLFHGSWLPVCGKVCLRDGHREAYYQKMITHMQRKKQIFTCKKKCVLKPIFLIHIDIDI